MTLKSRLCAMILPVVIVVCLFAGVAHGKEAIDCIREGTAKYEAGKYSEAIAVFQNAAAISYDTRESIIAWQGLEQIYRLLGNKAMEKEAVVAQIDLMEGRRMPQGVPPSTFVESARRNPSGDADEWAMKARKFEEAGQYRDAASAYTEAYGQSANKRHLSKAWECLGLHKQGIGDAKGAHEAYLKAIEAISRISSPETPVEGPRPAQQPLQPANPSEARPQPARPVVHDDNPRSAKSLLVQGEGLQGGARSLRQGVKMRGQRHRYRRRLHPHVRLLYDDGRKRQGP
jgi:tetratricopeptide (TPR) repeat protein